MSSKTCAQCGAENPVDATSCSQCSSALVERRGRSVGLWIGVTCGGCFLAVIGFGVLATLIVPNMLGHFVLVQREKAKVDVRMICEAITTYTIRNGGQAPETLEVLVTPDENGTTYLQNRQSVPLDPWRHVYVYEPPHDGKPFRVISYGKDGRPGGSGDDADIDSESLNKEH